jgi:saccharopine dehydrogenase-like NADP-dependent oxidoreductase
MPEPASNQALPLASGEWVTKENNPRQLDDLVERFGDRVRALELDVTDPQAAVRVVNETVTSATSAPSRTQASKISAPK